jgi:hypothetical protein
MQRNEDRSAWALYVSSCLISYIKFARVEGNEDAAVARVLVWSFVCERRECSFISLQGANDAAMHHVTSEIPAPILSIELHVPADFQSMLILFFRLFHEWMRIYYI